MDIYLSAITMRPRSVNMSTASVQLPCTEQTFMEGHAVTTMLLLEEQAEFEQRLLETNELVFEIEKEELPCFIRMLNVYGELVITK